MTKQTYTIVTDSAANLTDGLIETYQIPIVSLSYIMGGESYLSYEPGVKQDLKAVYAEMRNKTSVKTSCLNAGHCREVLETVLKQGQDVVFIAFSSGLSASYKVAEETVIELRRDYPERKILIADSLSAALGQGRLVTLACEMREAGKSIEEVYHFVQESKLTMCHLFTVENLYYLYRGGRVTRSKHLFADTLSIKPVMHMDDEGHLVAIGKAFGRKASLTNMASRLVREIVNPEEQTLYISHGDCIEDVEFLIKRISDKITVKGFVINMLDLVVGAHSGPGTVAVFYQGVSRNGDSAEEAAKAKASLLKKSDVRS